MQAKMKVPLVFLKPGFAAGAVQALFKAWIRAPLTLELGDEIEVDLPFAALMDSHSEPLAPTIRAAGRITNVAVHADDCLWYEFVAESTTIIANYPGETIPKYPSLSISR